MHTLFHSVSFAHCVRSSLSAAKQMSRNINQYAAIVRVYKILARTPTRTSMSNFHFTR